MSGGCWRMPDFPTSWESCGKPVAYRLVMECPVCGDLSPEWYSCVECAALARRGDSATKHGICGVPAVVSVITTAVGADT